MSLREKLKALEELQQVDVELAELRAEAEAVPRRRAEIEAGVGEVRKRWQAEQDRLAGVERERRSQEQTIAAERDKVKKWEGRLAEIRTPREYAALSREIDIAKKSNETQSEQVKQLAAEAADIRKALDERGDSLAEAELGAQAELKEVEDRRAAAEERLRGLDARRAEAAQKVDPGLLSKYETIKRRRAGVALAPVVGMTCSGCNRNIPPQLAITLQRANTIENCPSCHRIIYSADALNPPAPPPA